MTTINLITGDQIVVTEDYTTIRKDIAYLKEKSRFIELTEHYYEQTGYKRSNAYGKYSGVYEPFTRPVMITIKHIVSYYENDQKKVEQ